MSIPPLIAYTDRWSVRAGGRIEVKVSCSSGTISITRFHTCCETW